MKKNKKSVISLCAAIIMISIQACPSLQQNRKIINW